MKSMLNIAVAVGIGIGSVSAAAGAINAVQVNQQRLIDAGHRSGKLTGAEVARLRAEQRAIEATEARMRARHHGHLTDRDKDRLHARQRQAGRDIQHQKYDGQRGRNRLKL